MHFANQGKALQDKRYEFALKQLPVSHQLAGELKQQTRSISFAHDQQQTSATCTEPKKLLKEQNRRHLEETSYLANVVRNTKQSGSNYFGTGSIATNNNLTHRQSSLLDSNMSYQAHMIKRERQLESYVRGLQEEEDELNRYRESQRLAALEEARHVDRIKLHQSARNRIFLQQQSQQKVPDALLKKYGLDEKKEEIAAQRSHKAGERRELRELPRQAHIEYNLPRLMDSALCRLERIDAHHERINNRIALEEKVGTGYARKRMTEHKKVHKAKSESKKARSITAALSNNTNNTNQEKNFGYSSSSTSPNYYYDNNNNSDSDSDEDGTGALLMKKSRLPDLEELRQARELAKKNRLLLRDEEEEKKKLWEEMDRLDKQTAEDAKKARLARNKQSKISYDDDSD